MGVNLYPKWGVIIYPKWGVNLYPKRWVNLYPKWGQFLPLSIVKYYPTQFDTV